MIETWPTSAKLCELGTPETMKATERNALLTETTQLRADSAHPYSKYGTLSEWGIYTSVTDV
jgi:hypothetical protein